MTETDIRVGDRRTEYVFFGHDQGRVRKVGTVVSVDAFTYTVEFTFPTRDWQRRSFRESYILPRPWLHAALMDADRPKKKTGPKEGFRRYK